MKQLILITATLALFSCQQKSDKMIEIERLYEQSTRISADYKRHLERKATWATAPDCEQKTSAMDSMCKIDSQYIKQLDEILIKMEQLNKKP